MNILVKDGYICGTTHKEFVKGYDVITLTSEDARKYAFYSKLAFKTKIENNKIVALGCPPVVGSGQIRAAMIITGYASSDGELNAFIENTISQLDVELDRAIALTLWRNASEFKRNNRFIKLLQIILNKTSAEIDELFCLAITI